MLPLAAPVNCSVTCPAGTFVNEKRPDPSLVAVRPVPETVTVTPLMPPAPMSCSIPEAEPPFETTPEIVAPLELEFAPDAVGEGCAPSGAAGDGDFEELHAMALTSPTTTTVSR